MVVVVVVVVVSRSFYPTWPYPPNNCPLHCRHLATNRSASHSVTSAILRAVAARRRELALLDAAEDAAMEPTNGKGAVIVGLNGAVMVVEKDDDDDDDDDDEENDAKKLGDEFFPTSILSFFGVARIQHFCCQEMDVIAAGFYHQRFQRWQKRAERQTARAVKRMKRALDVRKVGMSVAMKQESNK